MCVLFLLAIAAGRFYFSDAEYRFLRHRVERIIEKKKEFISSRMEIVKDTGIDETSLKTLSNKLDLKELRRKGLTILIYQGEELVYWSDRAFDVPEEFPVIADTLPVIFIHNGYFLNSTTKSGDKTIIGLLRIYSIYDVNNNLVRSGFAPGFNLPGNAVLHPEKILGGYNVILKDGIRAFTISFQGDKENSALIILPIMLWTAFLLLLLLVTDDLTKLTSGRFGALAAFFLKLIVYFLLWLVIYKNLIPEVFKRTELFMSSSFSISTIIPSMGHLFVLSILLADLARTFYIHFRLQFIRDLKPARDLPVLVLLLIPATLMIIAIHHVLITMVAHTNLTFEGYRISHVNFLSVMGILSLFFLLMTPSFYIVKVIKILFSVRFYKVVIAILINLIIIVFASFIDINTGFVLALFYLTLVLLLRFFALNRMGIYNLSAFFSIIVSLYATWYITHISQQNEIESLKVSAVSLATNYDPVAEHLLIEMDSSLREDTLLRSILSKEHFDQTDAEVVSEYLRDIYFVGYWLNYDFSVVICNESSSLLIDDGDDIAENCFSFFLERVQDEGQPVTGTSFYFLDNKTGRPCYLGNFFIDLPPDGVNGLFIELYSHISAFREGYPELLTDEKYMRPARLKDYSLAKYIDGDLVINTGEFSYPKRDDDIADANPEFHALSRDGFEHFVYRLGETTVILSRRAIPVTNTIVSFAWLFLFLLFISAISALIYRKPVGKSIFMLTFRQKLQIAFVLIIFFTFLGIAAGASYLSIDQYRQRHYDSIREKARSLYIELDHKLEGESYLNDNWSDGRYNSLSELLVKFSNVFFTDINLYDKQGVLMSTSRPEVFIRDLTSRRMDKTALISLSSLQESEHIAWERIGKLEYLSIYVPFYNSSNELLAYLNIPYFGMQSRLSDEISNLIVAIVNFSLLMILATMSLAVLISDRITSPIKMLGEMLASVQLGRKSKRLHYPSGDEIGELVSRYNKMVEELEESARRLSASEREFAWREMAKQIAHEIKNPLTPMKLNVQQLEKSWKDGQPGFDKKLKKFTRNQIEYIENLSSIATAFSNFARMPKAAPVHVDLLEQIKTTLELFRNTGNITFRVNCAPGSRIVVFADREHLNSLFSNLVKNAIQAIPNDRAGQIKISIDMAGDKVVVRIADNGTGIPEDIKARLFTPYFTTKSSGSGLGLSIVKRLVEGMGGEIDFESEQNEGTVFIITLPVLYSIERKG
jgi:signal transduction histidine kinase